MAGVSRPADQQTGPRTLPRAGGKPGDGSGVKPKGNAAAKREAKQRQRQRRNRLITGGVVGLLVIGLIIVFVVQSGRSSTSKKAVVPAGAATAGTTAGGFSQGSGPVVVEEYGDFQCPHCEETFKNVGPTLDKLVASSAITYVFHNFAFIGNESTLTANAAVCASDVSIDKFWAMFNYLYSHQPATENSGFWTTDQLLAALQITGADTPQATACVKNHTYNTWVNQQAEAASKRGVNATPTFYINGVQYTGDTTSATAMQAAISAAAAKK